MDSLADLTRRDDHPDDPALRTGGDPAREYDYRRFRTTARKTGNFLRHLGVRDGTAVAVADDWAPEAILTLFGTWLLGGTVRFGPPSDVDARAVVAPTDRLDGYDLPPGGQRVGYGTTPTDPSYHHFERDVWSENPGFPPAADTPDAPALATGERTCSHAAVLAAAREAAADLDPDDVVAVRAPLSDPGTVAAGVVAPLLAGACVLLPGDGEETDDDGVTGTVAVVPDGDGTASEAQQVVAPDVD